MTIKLEVLLAHYFDGFGVKLKLYARQLPVYLLVLAIILPFVLITGKYIESVFQIIAFLILRYKFDTTYHAQSSIVCFFITITVGILAVVLMFSLNASLLSCLLMALFVTFVSWLVQYIIDLQKSQPFDLNKCTREEFVAQCRQANLSNESAEIAVGYLFDKNMTLQDIADKYNIDYYSAKQRVRRIRRKLEM